MIAIPEQVRRAPDPGVIDWRRVLSQVAISRALDDLEESTLLKERKVLYQFSARGHDLTQVLLSTQLTGTQDGVGGYYRSRPLLLGLGLPLEEALASTMMRAGGMSDGRDIGVVFNMPRKAGPCVLPVCGGVGAQYTPAVGWAQALRYRVTQLGEQACRGSIAVAHGGEASTATNGFWAALNIVTTERLPFLFFIEDNGYGISVSSQQQTPGGNIARNLSGFRGLRVHRGRRLRSARRRRPDPGCGRGCTVRGGAGAHPAAGSASFGSLGPGHANLQVRRGNRRGKTTAIL